MSSYVKHDDYRAGDTYDPTVPTNAPDESGVENASTGCVMDTDFYMNRFTRVE